MATTLGTLGRLAEEETRASLRGMCTPPAPLGALGGDSLRSGHLVTTELPLGAHREMAGMWVGEISYVLQCLGEKI